MEADDIAADAIGTVEENEEDDGSVDELVVNDAPETARESENEASEGYIALEEEFDGGIEEYAERAA